jgi:hypothetical protein
MVLLRDFAVDAKVNERSSQKFRHTPQAITSVRHDSRELEDVLALARVIALVLGRLHLSGWDPTKIRSLSLGIRRLQSESIVPGAVIC